MSLIALPVVMLVLWAGILFFGIESPALLLGLTVFVPILLCGVNAKVESDAEKKRERERRAMTQEEKNSHEAFLKCIGCVAMCGVPSAGVLWLCGPVIGAALMIPLSIAGLIWGIHICKGCDKAEYDY